MRWKLLIVAPLLATIVGAGAVLAITHLALGSTDYLAGSRGLSTATLLIPLAAIAFAAVFVYRHTARRRTLQAAATVLLSITLTLAALLVAAYFLAPRPSPPTDAPPQQTLNDER